MNKAIINSLEKDKEENKKKLDGLKTTLRIIGNLRTIVANFSVKAEEFAVVQECLNFIDGNAQSVATQITTLEQVVNPTTDDGKATDEKPLEVVEQGK